MKDPRSGRKRDRGPEDRDGGREREREGGRERERDGYRDSKRRRGEPDYGAGSAAKICVSNLPAEEVRRRSVTQDMLRTHFARYGPVVQANIVSRDNLGFVTLRHEADADRILNNR